MRRLQSARRWRMLSSALALMFLATFSTAGQAQDGDADLPNGVDPWVKHLALIIGNSDYDLDGALHVAPADRPPPGFLKDLKNPCRDAEMFRDRLLALHWKPEEITFGGCNLPAGEMRSLITTFRQKIANSKNTVAVFYFSGHGAQFVDGDSSHSFLFGAGAKVDLNAIASSLQTSPGNTSFAAEQAVDLFELVGSIGLQPDNAVLIVLDACRENPLYGLDLPEIQAVSANTDDFDGVVFAFSTPRGQFADDGNGAHSIYTSSLVGLMREAETIDGVLNNLPKAVKSGYKKAYPTRAGFQRPVVRGRFNGVWCVRACPAGTEPAPVVAFASSPIRLAQASGHGSSVNAGSHIQLAMAQTQAQGVKSDVVQAITPSKAPAAATVSKVPRALTLYNADAVARPRSDRLSEGVRFDVFWCDGGPGAEQRSARAIRIAAALTDQAKALAAGKDPSKDPVSISFVRVRTLSATANTLAAYRYTDDVVVQGPYDGDEFARSELVKLLRDANLKIVSKAKKTPDYVSVFICKARDNGSELHTPLFLQVPAEQQKGAGRALLKTISDNVPTVDPVKGIEARADGPSGTEVRFYYQEDRDNAFATADEVQKALNRPVTVKFMPSIAPGKRALELWLGRTDPPIWLGKAGQLIAPPSPNDTMRD